MQVSLFDCGRPSHLRYGPDGLSTPSSLLLGDIDDSLESRLLYYDLMTQAMLSRYPSKVQIHVNNVHIYIVYIAVFHLRSHGSKLMCRGSAGWKHLVIRRDLKLHRSFNTAKAFAR